MRHQTNAHATVVVDLQLEFISYVCIQIKNGMNKRFVIDKHISCGTRKAA